MSIPLREHSAVSRSKGRRGREGGGGGAGRVTNEAERLLDSEVLARMVAPNVLACLARTCGYSPCAASPQKPGC